MTSPPEASPTAQTWTEELNSTVIGRRTATVLTAMFLLVIIGIPLVDLTVAWRVPVSDDSRTLSERMPILRLVSDPPALREYPFPIQKAGDPTAENPARLIEQDVENSSAVRQWMQPRFQSVLTSTFVTGSPSVLIGADSWLFFREGIDYLAGRGFLHSTAVSPITEDDPRAVIIDFHRQCRAAGVDLLVVPISDKGAIESRWLVPLDGDGHRLTNPSFSTWKHSLIAAGVTVLAVDDELRRLATDGDAFLRQDTHWTPETMMAVAHLIAHHPLVASGNANRSWRREPVTVTGHGDLAIMLRLPTGHPLVQSQVVTIGQIVDANTGTPWEPDRSADVLLMGDSFTNIYQSPELGWGEGGGLGAQLAFLLGDDIDVIALNGDGVNGPRRRLASRPQQLSGKRVVIWAFAERNLAKVDWRMIPLNTGHGRQTSP